jgi:FKBP-type peptidyl-prolyl cis-trans isomerase SlyD
MSIFISFSSIPQVYAKTSVTSTHIQRIKPGALVSVQYALYDGNTLLDTSDKQIAQKGLIYNSERQYIPFSFTVWEHQVVPGFENAVIGMKRGESKKVTLEPKDGYGEYNTGTVSVVQRSELSNIGELKLWASYSNLFGNVTFRVTKIDGDNITIDYNHPLAGKKLTFLITVKTFTQYALLTWDIAEFQHGIMQPTVFQALRTPTYADWPSNAPLLIIEYSDPECPFCIRQYNDKTIETARKAYPGKTQYIYKPVEGVNHPGTMYKAQAILCAGEAWWAASYKSMYSAILGWSTIGNVFPTEAVAWVATKLWIGKKRQTCIDTAQTKPQYFANRVEVRQFGDSVGTPTTLIVNTKTRQYLIIPWAYDADLFTRVIGAMLQ